jgi:methylated-DNA-[protein]-cysteine S-methyltransferase
MDGTHRDPGTLTAPRGRVLLATGHTVAHLIRKRETRSSMQPTIHLDTTDTPLGRIWVAADGRALLRVLLNGDPSPERLEQELVRTYGPLAFRHGGEIPACFAQELAAYLQGEIRSFRTPVRPHGTPFQKRVWKVLARIPYGETRTYGWVARGAGIPGGARAVGQANARNPVPLLVPCHRVVAADGTLGGFSSGLRVKRFLLDLERHTVAALPPGRTARGACDA